jgi:hypothetical protein
MPGGNKKRADASLIAHLAASVSPAGAAKLAGGSEATVYRRLANPAFRQRVEKARSDFWERALCVISKGAAESAIVLRRLLRSDDGRLKLQAAKVLIGQGMKVREVVEQARQLEELRKEIDQLKKERENGNVWDRLAAVDAAADRADAAVNTADRGTEPPAGGSVDEGKADNVKPLFDMDGNMDSDIKPLFDRGEGGFVT